MWVPSGLFKSSLFFVFSLQAWNTTSARKFYDCALNWNSIEAVSGVFCKRKCMCDTSYFCYFLFVSCYYRCCVCCCSARLISIYAVVVVFYLIFFFVGALSISAFNDVVKHSKFNWTLILCKWTILFKAMQCILYVCISQ